MSSTDTEHVLRPHGATVLSIVVWAVAVAMALEALFSAGVGGLLVYPGLALIAALVWALLWAPRLVLRPAGVEVRNLLHTYDLPFARIQDVRLGAMVHFEVDELQGRSRRVTAWNAPGVGRDNPLARVGRPETGARSGGPGAGTQARRRLSRAERLRNDQDSSRSAIVRERWEEWQGKHPAADPAPARRSLNVVVLSVLAVVVALNALMLAF
ncbi:hypothetical protein CFK41_12690 [Brachybacterium ginsengisoli]|uniref:Low molecular weight protein antigen 6 PH domain-containing protein n=1 Tax=Brachybacterium ginsengisoli TaxID=1331682 RepID=A0A291GZL2_9MICO|nr:PH domain-containing protein [Brachybacterium ginsengisoli]ATG55534.1 hypothetical protein CFK41_12690 [Brachybacterium ginsengisoli]